MDYSIFLTKCLEISIIKFFFIIWFNWFNSNIECVIYVVMPDNKFIKYVGFIFRKYNPCNVREIINNL